MDIARARISTNGQVTIPFGIRRRLGLKDGDKVVFAEKGGDIVLLNSNRLAFEEFQRGMKGAAEEAGLKDEQDVVALVKQIRREMWGEQNESNA